ncbi:MAG TPA: class I SAM-dependent methyltransferase [Thermoanaerobaculia bacterium]|nr:class I SAM-dependent methyltransferase [Thermoanaerobaculia bacterium]
MDDFWDREIARPTHTSWMEPLEVRHYINEQISGDRGVWPLQWLKSTLHGRVFERALSLGCGTGKLERDLLDLGVCKSIDAFDGSIASLAEAKRLARGPIRYFAADLNRPALPRSVYDAAFFHQSLHHVAKIEKLLRAVLRALKPNALLYLDEFIGPSRHEWNDARLERYWQIYKTIPPEVRWFEIMPMPVQWDDPSEAVRSSEIVRRLRVGFHIDHFRGYGGNILAVLFPALSRVDPPLLHELLEHEKAAIAAGEPHFHAVIVAHPAAGLRRAIARARYFVEPKISLALRAARSALRSSAR